MAVTIAEITKLRKLSGAGLADCKKALTESEGDIEKAMEIIRKKGQAVAAKRSDRDASEGCVLVKSAGDFAIILALKCETDFVANNADFVALTQSIIDAAVANNCKSIEEVLALPMGNGTIQDAITERSGITGEKMELDGFCRVEGAYINTYNHMKKNILCTMVAFNKVADEKVAHDVAMQIAAMNPIAIDQERVPQEVKDREFAVAVDKTKAEQVQKAVEAALKKAGFNLYTAESEEHLNEGIMKGYITEAQADEIRKLKAEVAEQKAANMPAQMVENIAKGRLAKFFKEVCLLEQQDTIQSDKNVAQVLKEADPELKVIDFKRFTLRAE